MPHSSNIPNLVGHTIDHGRLRLTARIGSGSNGVIFVAQDTAASQGGSPAEYAVKCIIKAEKGTRRYALQRQEIDFHRRLSHHPNVVTLHRVIEEKHYIFLVMDYCRGGDFFTFLSKRRDYRGDDDFVRRMFLQIIDALQACHDAGIYHRDIKPENFLISEDGTQLFLTDFGLATTNLYSITYGAGSSLYMSPECIGIDSSRPAYNTAANDVWALGVILTSMISGHNPWNVASPTDACYAAFTVHPGFLAEMLPISPAASTLLQRIFRRERAPRITLSGVRQAVQAADTFFMRPEHIARAGEYLRSAAESYFAGGRNETYYMTWTSRQEESSAPGERGGQGAAGGSGRPGSASSTLETSGPETPELRAQQLHVEVSEDCTQGGELYLSRLFASRESSPPRKPQAMTTGAGGTPGFLRRIVDRFLVEQ